MYELPATIPDAHLLLALEPEELGAKMLFLLRKRQEKANQTQTDFHLSNLLGELWQRIICRARHHPIQANCKARLTSPYLKHGHG
jgi:hypothetical protein